MSGDLSNRPGHTCASICLFRTNSKTNSYNIQKPHSCHRAAQERSMITRDMIRDLAEFQSPQGDAITFYYQPQTPQDKSHRQEAITIKDIVKDAMKRAERAGKNGS